MTTTQIGNRAAGDVVAGNKFQGDFHFTPPTSLSRLYSILRESDLAQKYTAQIADTLHHYCNIESGDVRGLEEKLTSAGREHTIPQATSLKERAFKLIMRWQTSAVTQDIITHILAKLHGEFMLNVQPAIQAGRSVQEVDEIIRTKVIGPTESMLGENDLGITLVDIVGLLYFLGGNCHVRWDKC